MCPSCALRQLMGALMEARKKVIRMTCWGMLCLHSSARRSSTYSKPSTVTESAGECVCDAKHRYACALPPVCIKLCSEVADNVVI